MFGTRGPRQMCRFSSSGSCKVRDADCVKRFPAPDVAGVDGVVQLGVVDVQIIEKDRGDYSPIR